MEDTLKQRITSNHHAMLWTLFIVGLVLRGFGLSEQPPLDDEVGIAFDAVNYMEHGRWSRIMWEHPPLRNIVVAVTGRLFGDYTAWGLRFGSVVFGCLSVPLLGYLAYGLFGSRLVACLSAFFLCIDPLHISLSRQAVQETTTACFIIAGVLATCHAVKRNSMLLCCIAGLCFGLASASKWHGLFPWAVSAAAYLFAPWFLKGTKSRERLAERLLTVLAAYVALPLVVYASVFLPWLHRGHSLAELADFHVFLVKANYAHKASEYAEKFLPQRAYQWFLMPLAWNDFVFSSGKPYLNVAMGNFLVWVGTLPALCYSAWEWLRVRRFGMGYLLSVFLISYFPLLFTKRGIWVYNSLAVVPFAFLLVAYAIVKLLDIGVISRRILAGYLFAAALLSCLMYPMSTFRTLEHPVLRKFAEIYSPHRGQGQQSPLK